MHCEQNEINITQSPELFILNISTMWDNKILGLSRGSSKYGLIFRTFLRFCLNTSLIEKLFLRLSLLQFRLNLRVSYNNFNIFNRSKILQIYYSYIVQ